MDSSGSKDAQIQSYSPGGANVYRPPSPSTATQLFFDELADHISALITSSSQAVVVCGDLNCQGDTSNTIDNSLACHVLRAQHDVFRLFQQLVRSPTRYNSLLDVLVCSDDGKFVHDVVVDDAGGVSDHRLVKAQFRLGVSRWVPVAYNFRPLESMDYSAFEQSRLASALFSAPTHTVDTFTDQLKHVSSSTLNELAPLRTVTRVIDGTHINRFLSREAISTKRKRRRFERW